MDYWFARAGNRTWGDYTGEVLKKKGKERGKKKVFLMTSTTNQTKLVGCYNTQAYRCVAQLLPVILWGAACANQQDI